MNRESVGKALKFAGWIVLPGAVVSLLVCMLFYGMNLFQTLLPVELTVVFGGLAFAFARIPGIRNRMWLRVVLCAVAVVAAVVLLRAFR